MVTINAGIMGMNNGAQQPSTTQPNPLQQPLSRHVVAAVAGLHAQRAGVVHFPALVLPPSGSVSTTPSGTGNVSSRRLSDSDDDELRGRKSSSPSSTATVVPSDGVVSSDEE